MCYYVVFPFESMVFCQKEEKKREHENRKHNDFENDENLVENLPWETYFRSVSVFYLFQAHHHPT